jgi:hypothetical protein
MKAITLKDYAKIIGFEGEVKSLQEIQDYCENEYDLTLWDYSTDELTYCIEEDRNVILVEVLEDEYRLCEF